MVVLKPQPRASTAPQGMPRPVKTAHKKKDEAEREAKAKLEERRFQAALVKEKASPFSKLRNQLEFRRQANLLEQQRQVADVSLDVFTEEEPPGQSSFQICGALPPTTSARERCDVDLAASIGQAERRAAEDFLRKRQEQQLFDAERKARAVRSARGSRPSTTNAPSSRGKVGVGIGDLPLPPWQQQNPAAEDEDHFVEPVAVADLGILRPGEMYDVPAWVMQKGRSERAPPARDWKDWENKLCDWYGMAEDGKNQMCNQKVLHDRDVEESFNQKEVVRLHFERRHKRAEDAIIAQGKVKATQQEYRQYCEGEEERWRSALEQRQVEERAAYESVKQFRAEAAARKKSREVFKQFEAKAIMIRQTCLRMDRQDRRADNLLLARERKAALQRKWQARKSHLQTRTALAKAHWQEQDVLDRDFQAALLSKEKTRQRTLAAAKHDKIVGERQLRHILRQMAQDVVDHGRQDAAPLGSQAYEQTLHMLDDFVNKVREHGLSVRGIVEETGHPPEEPEFLKEDVIEAFEPMFPKIRSALSTAAGTARPWTEETEERDDDYDYGHFDPYIGGLVEADRAMTAPEGVPRTAREALAQAREAMAQQPRATTAPTKDLPPLLAPSMLTVNALESLADIGRAPVLAAPHSARGVPGEAGSLSALRQIRRTGPRLRQG
eukprot:TRINITY_DN27849_c0_g1_i1.p1 TRINITY_DN27849_c0_g1~~TRINITY_DN27849_c0_g1_i1.p1  ORF type:complete len:687 (+),score=188.34 TRINITY_DN27849_c0_g1_i1:63-2063(+)